MLTRVAFLLVAAVGVLIALQQKLKAAPVPQDYVRGRNNTVLYVVSEHPGHSNVHVATAQSLLLNNPDIEINFASFPKRAKTVSRVSAFAKQQQPLAKDIIFHPLNGTSFHEAFDHYDHLVPDEDGRVGAIQPPGTEGIKALAKDIQVFIAPWQQEEHLAHYRQVRNLIERIDPAVVCLDTMFAPAIEATRALNRQHAFITPNILVDNFPDRQPWLGMLWKYPAMGSGFPFPVPLNLIPQNIALNFRMIKSLISTPDLSAKRAFLSANGVPDPINFYGLHRPDVPWITQTTPAATIPVDVVPQNVTCAGPIVVLVAPASAQDPELVSWIAQKPTVLLNLGSAFIYSRTHTRHMVAAIHLILETNPDVQILWKYRLSPNVRDLDWQALVAPLEATQRVKVTRWLSVDPSALLETGHIVAHVTHGGAGGFHESISPTNYQKASPSANQSPSAGVPQVVLPLWADLYNYAQLAEQSGIGFWACRQTSPEWTPECLRDGILRVAASDVSEALRRRAREISVEARKGGLGRDIAAGIVARLARAGDY